MCLPSTMSPTPCPCELQAAEKEAAGGQGGEGEGGEPLPGLPVEIKVGVPHGAQEQGLPLALALVLESLTATAGPRKLSRMQGIKQAHAPDLTPSHCLLTGFGRCAGA